MAGENLRKLVELMAFLRSSDGCPWDRTQDYDTLKSMVLEEAYEVVDAVNGRDFEGLEEELGDLLFQAVFYSRLAEEEGRFSIDSVIERVHAKLVRRHPHVFGPKRAGDAQEALKSWNQAKREEGRVKGEKGESHEENIQSVDSVTETAEAHMPESLLAGIPKNLPSTLEAHKIGVRAAEAGFDWVRVEDLLRKIEEEIGELREELGRADSACDNGGAAATPSIELHGRIEEEIGDLLFTAANLARYLRSDAETCLRRANRKFRRRFQALEAEVAKRGRQVREYGPEELDAIWSEVKSSGA